MPLPRPKSVLDATPLRGAFATLVPTGAPKRAAEDMSSGGGDQGCDLTECSDTEFNAWFETQFPTPGMERWFNDQMMQAWMTLTTAATEAIAEVANGTYEQSMPPMPRPEQSEYGGSLSTPDYAAEQAEYIAHRSSIMGHRNRAKTLLARARRAQTKISFVV